jgi:hypothetical protein
VGFLVTAAGLTALALADDAFQLHESVLVDATGLAERVWYVMWAAVVVVWVVAFRRDLVRSPAELALAAGLLATSQAIDAVPVLEDMVGRLPGRPLIWEESLKLLGIGSFTAFAAREVGAAATLAFASGGPSLATPDEPAVWVNGEMHDRLSHAAAPHRR